MRRPPPTFLSSVVHEFVVLSNESEYVGIVGCPCGEAALELLYVADLVIDQSRSILRVTEWQQNLYLVLEAHCPRCDKRLLLFDMSRHGFNGLVRRQKSRGRSEANRDRIVWECPNCGEVEHAIRITVGGDTKLDTLRDHSDLVTEKNWQDAFGMFQLEVTCVDCKHGPLSIVEFETQ